MSLLVQPFKFGTIGFFLISGFLLGDRLPATNRLAYLDRRAKRLLPAWVLWFALQVLFIAKRDLMFGHGGSLAAAASPYALWTIATKVLTESPLWFVPNFLVALTCLVLLRNWLDDLRLGAALLAVNIFYGVNVYSRWLPSRHTEAVFGFVFYLWMGAWCALRRERLQAWVAERSGGWLVFWACVAACVSLFEVKALAARNSPDIFNSLRFSNQIYSVLIVILLVRIRRRTWPAFINVAETTYGIYLTHAMVVGFVFAAAASLVHMPQHLLG
jgi:surface polysaccharide O-acyltransferase-like enzyme